jgi:hypothetical protein
LGEEVVAEVAARDTPALTATSEIDGRFLVFGSS